MRGVLLLAIDGLHWPTLMTFCAAGQMPQLQQLLGRGVQTRLSLPVSSESTASRWTSIACGLDPAEHGIAHDLVCRADGLRVTPPIAGNVRAVPLWQLVWRAGLSACVANWPASRGSTLPASAGAGSMLIADGFARPEAGVECAWPLSPDAAVPSAARALVQAARMHPADVNDTMLAALLPGSAPEPLLRGASAELLARWASVHNLGVHWCSQADTRLVMLRLDGLPAWQRSAGAASQQPWLAWLDLLLGRYAALLHDDAALVLLSDRGGSDDDADGGLLVSGSATTWRPALQHWPARLPSSLLLPIVLDLLGLTAPQAIPASIVSEASNACVAQDDAALAWLHAAGVAPIDLSPLRQRSQALRDATRRALQSAQSIPPA